MFGDENKRWDVGVAAALIDAGKIALVRPTYGRAVGTWVLPGGFAEHEELLDEAAQRELLEETGLRGEVVDMLGLRTRYRDDGGAVYVVFRLRLTGGAPAPDGCEVDAVRFFGEAEVLGLPMLETMRVMTLTALRAPRRGPVEVTVPNSGPAYRLFMLDED